MPEARVEDGEVATKEPNTPTTLGTFIPDPPSTYETNVNLAKISTDPPAASTTTTTPKRIRDDHATSRALTTAGGGPVIIVSMPFADAGCPSIQLGLLTAIVRAHGFPVRSLHANLDFAAQIGDEFYQKLSGYRGRLIGEWLFSVAAFGESAPDPDALLLDEIIDDLWYLGSSPAEIRRRLSRLRQQEIPAYLDALLDALPWDEVSVVGFSSTYQQNTASFAFARRLKQRYPGIVTVFGGANFAGDAGIELVRSMECIDLAIAGEADEALPRLLGALAAGADVGTVPGVIRRVAGGVAATPPDPPISQLDVLPIPEYDEYFERAAKLGLLTAADHRRVWIPLETARGCWWGARHSCVFCGLNTNILTFRSKSPARAYEELASQARRYGSFRLAARDNILDPRYLTTLFPRIAENGQNYKLFYEVKANLRRPQLRLLAQAGVTQVQPGIESLSSHVLRLMRKGVTAAQNINFLRWAAYYEIDAAWNILLGIPGENRQDYAAQAAIMPHLVHLQPPSSIARIWLERFSPLYSQPEKYGIRSIWPEPSYHYIYPKNVDLEAIAYFFKYEMDEALPDETYDEVRNAVRSWQEARQGDQRPALTYWSAPQYLQIWDARHQGRDGTHVFDGTPAEVYLACSERPTSAAAVQRRLADPIGIAEIEEMFDEFQRLGLLFRDGSLALALALPAVAGR